MRKYNVIDNIIDTIDSCNIIAIFKDDSKYIINLENFINNHRLDDAKIFKMLFNINKNTSFANLPMISENGYITLLKDLNIIQTDWILFENFITKETIPGFNKLSIRYNKMNDVNNLFIDNIERINIVCSKLGGIPYFDNFYNKVMNESIIIKDNPYNPLKPEDDILNKYKWMIYNSSSSSSMTTFITTIVKPSWGWSCGSCSKLNNNSITYYYKKINDL